MPRRGRLINVIDMGNDAKKALSKEVKCQLTEEQIEVAKRIPDVMEFHLSIKCGLKLQLFHLINGILQRNDASGEILAEFNLQRAS